MNVIGFDSSTAATSVCLLREDGRAFERDPAPERLFERPAHAAELLPAVEAVLEEAGAGWAQVDAIAVGVGPGTFTGLRIGIATARALAHANGAELRPVSSLAALAAGIDAPLRLPLIDAKRGELFAALHDGERQLWEPFVAAPAELAERLREAPGNPAAAGDGSLRFAQVLEAAGVTVAPRESPSHVVRALHVCRLAAGARAVPPEAVLPMYLRSPDAKPRHP
jgi:tRNA threonylcarbamoyladenosine biosynthesis protein TsaB